MAHGGIHEKEKGIALKAMPFFHSSVLRSFLSLDYTRTHAVIVKHHPVGPPVAIPVCPYLNDLAAPAQPCYALWPAVIVSVDHFDSKVALANPAANLLGALASLVENGRRHFR